MHSRKNKLGKSTSRGWKRMSAERGASSAMACRHYKIKIVRCMKPNCRTLTRSEQFTIPALLSMHHIKFPAAKKYEGLTFEQQTGSVQTLQQNGYGGQKCLAIRVCLTLTWTSTQLDTEVPEERQKHCSDVTDDETPLFP
jgi:hypothetical protein